MIVAGIMSGTSADGVDVAIVRLPEKRSRLRFELIAHCAFPYPDAVREAVLKAMNSQSMPVCELARMNFLLAEIYADCVRKTQRQAGVVCELIGCHGQTLYHQGQAAKYLGRNIACTLQLGDGSVIATRLKIPVVSDFRPADMAAGGLGAPLVPFLDLLVFRHPRRGRIVQNIGGIANLTAIPSAAKAEQVLAFDTGPGNMVMDAVCEKLFGQPFDDGGKLAARGRVLHTVLDEQMKHPFFSQKGPRTAGREEFGREFVSAFLTQCGQTDNYDILATATALTARSIARAVRVLSKKNRYHDLFVSGGGTRNLTLMNMISDEVADLGLSVLHTDAAGIPSQAKEAIAFAVLAYQTWQHKTSNIPGATGASREVILGKVSYA